MTYSRIYYLLITSFLLGIVQLNPLYAQEKAVQDSTQTEARPSPDDDSSAGNESDAERAFSVDDDIKASDTSEPTTTTSDSGDAEITDGEVPDIIKQMEAIENQVTKAKLLDYKVVNRFPHRPAIFTQGLIVDGDILIESSGGYGKSSLSKVSLKDGEVLAEEEVPPHLFAEGVARLQDSLYQLTYRRGVLRVYDAQTLRFSKQLQYNGEGWGITTDGEHLIMSDGSDILKYMDAEDFKEVRRISVTKDDRPLKYLNELEWVEGKIYANVWLRNKIVIIDPETGKVTSYLDLKELLDEVRAATRTGVLNGIAYDAKDAKLYVTGKNWPTLFEIEIDS